MRTNLRIRAIGGLRITEQEIDSYSYGPAPKGLIDPYVAQAEQWMRQQIVDPFARPSDIRIKEVAIRDAGTNAYLRASEAIAEQTSVQLTLNGGTKKYSMRNWVNIVVPPPSPPVPFNVVGYLALAIVSLISSILFYERASQRLSKRF